MGLTELVAGAVGFVLPLFEDVCDLIDAKYIPDGNGAYALDPSSPRVDDVPCFYESPSAPSYSVDGAAQTWENKSRLILKALPETYAIASNYIIEVHARADVLRPALTFEQPTMHHETYWPIVEVICTLKNDAIS